MSPFQTPLGARTLRLVARWLVEWSRDEGAARLSPDDSWYAMERAFDVERAAVERSWAEMLAWPRPEWAPGYAESRIEMLASELAALGAGGQAAAEGARARLPAEFEALVRRVRGPTRRAGLYIPDGEADPTAEAGFGLLVDRGGDRAVWVAPLESRALVSPFWTDLNARGVHAHLRPMGHPPATLMEVPPAFVLEQNGRRAYHRVALFVDGVLLLEDPAALPPPWVYYLLGYYPLGVLRGWDLNEWMDAPATHPAEALERPGRSLLEVGTVARAMVYVLEAFCRGAIVSPKQPAPSLWGETFGPLVFALTDGLSAHDPAFENRDGLVAGGLLPVPIPYGEDEPLEHALFAPREAREWVGLFEWLDAEHLIAPADTEREKVVRGADGGALAAGLRIMTWRAGNEVQHWFLPRAVRPGPFEPVEAVIRAAPRGDLLALIDGTKTVSMTEQGVRITPRHHGIDLLRADSGSDRDGISEVLPDADPTRRLELAALVGQAGREGAVAVAGEARLPDGVESLLRENLIRALRRRRAREGWGGRFERHHLHETGAFSAASTAPLAWYLTLAPDLPGP